MQFPYRMTCGCFPLKRRHQTPPLILCPLCLQYITKNQSLINAVRIDRWSSSSKTEAEQLENLARVVHGWETGGEGNLASTQGRTLVLFPALALPPSLTHAHIQTHTHTVPLFK